MLPFTAAPGDVLRSKHRLVKIRKFHLLRPVDAAALTRNSRYGVGISATRCGAERWFRASQRPCRCFITALCLAVACTTARDESRWLNSTGGGIVRAVPLESPYPSEAKSRQVAVQVKAANETLFVSRCGRAELSVTLQWRREGKWIAVPEQFCSYVLAPPLVVPPGTTASETLLVPVDPAGEEHEFRVLVAIYTAWRTAQPPDAAAALPEALRLSNSFRLVRR